MEELQQTYEPIPTQFILDYDQMSIRSPSGWIFYYANGLVITPLGEIWF